MAEPLNIGILFYPNVTQLDATGPAQVLARVPGATIHMIWKTRDPVPTDAGFSVVPSTTFADCPQLDVICVPGGGGQVVLMTDEETLDFLLGPQFIDEVDGMQGPRRDAVLAVEVAGERSIAAAREDLGLLDPVLRCDAIGVSQQAAKAAKEEAAAAHSVAAADIDRRNAELEKAKQTAETEREE